MAKEPLLVAFAGDACIASGEPGCIARAVKKAAAAGNPAPILVFDAVTGEQTDVDLRDAACTPPAPAPSQLAAEPAADEPRGPGRPKLGVVAREITLLPRHWDWLAAQSGGASVALRKLVEQAMRASGAADRIRAAQNAAYRFMAAIAGNRPGFEEAARALFAGDAATFARLVEAWPKDIAGFAKKLAADALPEEKNAA